MTTLTWDRHKGHAHTYDVVELGYNYRLDEMRAAIGLVQLDKLERNNRRRAEIAQTYRQSLAGTPGLTIPFGSSTGCSSHHIFPILLDEGISRSEFTQKMKEFGVQTSIHYPPVHLFSYYRERYGYSEGALPIAEQVAGREVTLPLHPLMRDADVDYVTSCVKDALQASILRGKGRAGWPFD
jgi:dTDP-4-amino-4,6-dideoxygalactose transaminase